MIKLWEYMPDIDIMINSLRWRWPKPKVLRVWVDSGGYQIMVKGLKIDLRDLIIKYRALDADIYISLDIPPKQLCSIEKQQLMENIKNFEILYTKLEDKKIVPVVHCYDCSSMLEVIDIYKRYDIDIIAFGGVVPPTLAKNGKGCRIAPILALAIVSKAFKKKIHTLGVGGTSTMYNILKILDVYSLDSSSWRTKAAYGKVIIPGYGERYVGNGKASFGRKDLTDDDREALFKALATTKFPYMENIDEMLSTFRGRAIINAWIVHHFINTISEYNGFAWLIEYTKNIKNRNVSELCEYHDRLLFKLKLLSTKNLNL
jgi:7-cyano-7-deazaguanine tRNA-ribosyltransferase